MGYEKLDQIDTSIHHIHTDMSSLERKWLSDCNYAWLCVSVCVSPRYWLHTRVNRNKNTCPVLFYCSSRRWMCYTLCHYSKCMVLHGAHPNKTLSWPGKCSRHFNRILICMYDNSYHVLFLTLKVSVCVTVSFRGFGNENQRLSWWSDRLGIHLLPFHTSVIPNYTSVLSVHWNVKQFG